jgi:hypothetical protein
MRLVSGHIFLNGNIEFGQARGNAAAGGGKTGWQPTKDAVDTTNGTIYNPKKKKRKVIKQEGWWFIEKGGEKVYF